MMRKAHRTGRFLAAVTLTLILLAAPAAWAFPGVSPGAGGWLGQLWHALTAWVYPAESGASMDPSGLQAPAEQNASPEPWQPSPLDPAATDAASGEEDDRGASMDPHG